MASGTADLQRDFGGAIMTSIFGATLTAGYAHAFAAQISNLSTTAQQRISGTLEVELQKSYASAATIAQQHPEYSKQIIAAAKSSFLVGDQWTYLIGIMAILLGAAIIFFIFPKKDEEKHLLKKYHGEKEYELSIADQEFLSSMMSYLSQYKLQKREENLKFNKKIAKIAEENNPIEKKVSRKDSPSSLNWDILNKKIEKVSKKKFEDGYYADAVESAFKEINFRIKGIVEDVTGRELDGQNLMDVAFAFSRTSGPIIKLADLSKTTGRNIQKGYKNIFSGSIQGIRNPKAHE